MTKQRKFSQFFVLFIRTTSCRGLLPGKSNENKFINKELNGIKNNFEENQEGLFYKSEILSECVKIVDEDVYNKLLEKNIKCEFFCLRWFVVLFGQDFDMGDVIRIWDFVFSSENKNYLLFYVCLAVINLRRNVIINGEMNEILQGFQNLRDLMCDDVIFLAVDIRNKWKDKLDNIIKKTLN